MTIPSSAHGQEPDAGSSLTQTEIARLLVSPRPGEVGRGIMQLGMPRGGIRLPGIPPEEWGPELRAAIVRAVEQKAWLDAPEGWGELHNELYDAVVVIGEMGDPAAIGPLASFGMSGLSVFDALVSLGQPALREVIRTAKGPGGTRVQRSARRAAFIVMAMFVDERGPQGLDAGLLSEIRGLAASALDDPELVMRAIDLSVLLGDAELTGKVKRLAAAPSAALGITDAVRIDKIRERARGRLRDPTPFWYDLERWRERRLKRCTDRDDSESGVCRRLLADRR
ncbi:MAG: hypothetical protein OXU64_12610 [Gemmatimonadota bacterium]|nr:hypothetical protein [Gemmatimonadota bacterium]